MLRQFRIEYPGAIYHVMNRSDRRDNSKTFQHERDSLPGWPEGLMTSISAPFRRLKCRFAGFLTFLPVSEALLREGEALLGLGQALLDD